MLQDLVEKIQNVGHWRVNFRPPNPPDQRLTMAECHEIVNRSRVSIRGWDYPHVQRNQDHGGWANVGEYAENWCDWERHAEFWRMYRSTQFLHYRALTEDLTNSGPGRPEGAVLSVLGAIYTVSEITEFASRLHQNGLYKDSLDIYVGLIDTEDRQLWISQFDRMSFFDTKSTKIPRLDIHRHVEAEQLVESPRDVSLSILLELFDHFGWNPDPSLVQSDQEKFYKRQW